MKICSTHPATEQNIKPGLHAFLTGDVGGTLPSGGGWAYRARGPGAGALGGHVPGSADLSDDNEMLTLCNMQITQC